MSILSHNQAPSEEDVYFIFINSIKSDVTKENYERNLKSFMKFCNVTKLSDLLVIEDPQKQIVK